MPGSGLSSARSFHRYREGYRFAKLACDLVEKHGFIAYQAKVHHAMGWLALWTQPIATAIDFNRAAFRAAIETGDLTYACFSMFQSVTGLLLRNDPLDAVWRESEKSLDFARKAKFRDVADIIVSQQRFIATMQGRTATFSTFSDAQFDEATFEAQLTGDGDRSWSAWYWILKLKARFLAGDYAEALAAADKAKALLWAAAAHIQLLDYFYYTALTVAALYENGFCRRAEQMARTPDGAPGTTARVGRQLSTDFRRQARAGVGRDRPPRRARRRRNASVRAGHSVGSRARLRPERRRRPRACCGFLPWPRRPRPPRAPICGTRVAALRAGARSGKVRQLDQRYPRLREKAAPPLPTATIGTPVEQLDVGTVVKASQAVSGEIVLDKLIETLMTDRARTCRRRARACSSCSGATSRGSRRRRRPADGRVEVMLRQDSRVTGRACPNPCSIT